MAEVMNALSCEHSGSGKNLFIKSWIQSLAHVPLSIAHLGLQRLSVTIQRVFCVQLKVCSKEQQHER